MEESYIEVWVKEKPYSEWEWETTYIYGGSTKWPEDALFVFAKRIEGYKKTGKDFKFVFK